MAITKPSDVCRLAGLDSFAELVRITEMPENTLLRWFKTKPQAFKILVQGAVVEKMGGLRSANAYVMNQKAQIHLIP